MKMQHVSILGLSILAMIWTAGCATKTIPYQKPISATPPTGNVAVAQAVNVLDASGSHEADFAQGRATLESIVGVMPDGSYSAGNVIFGGMKREATGMSKFDRAALASSAKEAPFLQGSTPIFEILESDLTDSLGNTSGRAAIVLISDGMATDYVGRGEADERTVAAARALAANRSGETCIHTVHTGNNPAGRKLMSDLAAVTNCGSSRSASSLGSASALQQFSRDVYLGGVAATPKRTDGDADQDGVLDSVDACPNTLKAAKVDSRGCWTLMGVTFGVNSAELAGDSKASLKEDLAVLRANPTTRIRVDGYTDSDGAEAYNQSLSERRAEAVRNYFVEEGGIAADRIEVKGFGESGAIVPNDSPANKRKNRRVELTIID